MQSCELLKPVDNRFSGMLCKQGGRKGGGAFISQWKRWSGVFAPARANENKTTHRFTRYPLHLWG